MPASWNPKSLAYRIVDEITAGLDATDKVALDDLIKRLNDEEPYPRRQRHRRVPVDAFTIDILAERGPIGRTQIYNEINSGALVARKRAGRTFVLASDWAAWLAGAPPIEPANVASASTPAVSLPRRGRGRPRKQHAVLIDSDAAVEPDGDLLYGR